MSGVTQIIRKQIKLRNLSLVALHNFVQALTDVYGTDVKAPISGDTNYANLTIVTDGGSTETWMNETAQAYEIPLT